jgi:hypothetical protein
MVRISPGRKLLARRMRAAKEGIDLLSVAQDLRVSERRASAGEASARSATTGHTLTPSRSTITWDSGIALRAAQEGISCGWWNSGARSACRRP